MVCKNGRGTKSKTITGKTPVPAKSVRVQQTNRELENRGAGKQQTALLNSNNTANFLQLSERANARYAARRKEISPRKSEASHIAQITQKTSVGIFNLAGVAQRQQCHSCFSLLQETFNLILYSVFEMERRDTRIWILF